jgi:predicted dehydrogenase
MVRARPHPFKNRRQSEAHPPSRRLIFPRKGQSFRRKERPQCPPAVYGSYAEVYADPDVDIVYIGTPHAFHKQNCLNAITAGKHILCEKAFTIPAKETQEVLSAAQGNGVFIMEAMWTRFHPLVLTLRKMLHEEKIIGNVRRTFCDFGLEMNISALGPESRLKNPALGAGNLLEIAIYSLT